MAITQTYNNVNPIREDLVDKIWDVSPTDTPIVSAIPKVKAANTYHEWQTDALAAPALNAAVEGADATEAQATDTTRLGNYTQISQKVASVSNTANSTKNAGMGTQMSYQVARRMEELKTDIEFMLCGRTEADGHIYVAGNATTARKAAAIQAYVASNIEFGTGGDAPAGTGADQRTAATTDLDWNAVGATWGCVGEDKFHIVMAEAFNNGGSPSMMVVPPTIKQETSASFTTAATRYVTTDKKTLNSSIDVIDSDFGTVTIVPSRIIADDDVLILDPEYLALAELRKMNSYELGITGDKTERQVVWEGTLEVRNEKAHAAIYDVA